MSPSWRHTGTWPHRNLSPPLATPPAELAAAADSIGVTIVTRVESLCHHWCHQRPWAQHPLSPPQASLGDSMIIPGHPHLSPLLPVQRRRQSMITLNGHSPRLGLPLVIEVTGHQPASVEKSLALAISPTTPATSPDSRQGTPWPPAVREG